MGGERREVNEKEMGLKRKRTRAMKSKKRLYSVRFIGWEDRKRQDAYVMKEVRASVRRVSALSATSR